MTLSALHADIAARYTNLNESIAKGAINPAQAGILSTKYVYPVSKDASGPLGVAQYNAPQRQGIQGNCIPFIISTQQVDSDGDIVVSLGCQTQDRYVHNPIIYFGHGSWQVPIGVARKSIDAPVEVFPDQSAVRSNAYFDMPDPDAHFIHGKIERGILNTASVSFLPVHAYRREQSKAHSEDMQPIGWLFERWELTEWSVVGIPANAGAIRDVYDSEKSFMSPKLQKAWLPFAAVAKGRCFSGYCPCPPCEEKSADQSKFSSTQFDLEAAGYSRSQGSPVDAIKKMAMRIKDADLAEDGREENVHVTIKYGLHTDDAEEVQQIVSGFGPVVIKLGKSSLFPAKEAGDQRGGADYDVVKIDVVDSPDLVRLNQLISDSLECTDTHPNYKPHVTLAYVKPGLGRKYVGNSDVAGMQVNCSELVFSNQSHEKSAISLINKKAANMSTKLNAATLTSGLPGAKSKHKGTCKCKKCKKALPEQTDAASGAEAAGVHSERNEHQEHEAEQMKAELQAGVDAKMPKLIECGYEPAQAMCLAAHLHGKGLEGDDITGHEEAAKALGYKSKDDMGGDSGSEGGYSEGGEESMSLKSHVAALKKSNSANLRKKESDEEEAPKAEAEDEPAAEAETEEEVNDEADEQYKPSAKMLGHMHNHMKNAHDYLSKELPVMDHPQIAKAMTAHCKDLEGHMENYKELAGAHHPDLNFDKMCKSLEGGETEHDENESGANSETEATSGAEDHGSTEESGQDLIRDYQHPKGSKRGARKSTAEDLDPELTKTLAGTLERVKGFVDQKAEEWFRISGQRR